MTPDILRCDVAVIGGGPAGLAAATELKLQGVGSVMVLEREGRAGGIPRHCGHPPFGMREFGRIYTGPRYAAKLVERAEKAGVTILLRTNVVQMLEGPVLLITSDTGVQRIKARRVIYATGVRETSRAGQMLGGQRPQGVLNTGALQSMVFEYGKRPFLRPVILGTELVSFSALMTCAHAGIKPVAMIEASNRTTARWPARNFARLKGVPIHFNSRVLRINGERQIRSVVIQGAQNQTREIACDGLILSGQFRPESSLCQASHLQTDAATLGPVVDQFGRCSDPLYFATGNVLRPVETAGWSWHEGRIIGQAVARDLARKLSDAGQFISLTAGAGLKYVMPQRLVIPMPDDPAPLPVQLRVTGPTRGLLAASTPQGQHSLRSLISAQERRITLRSLDLLSLAQKGPVTLQITRP